MSDAAPNLTDPGRKRSYNRRLFSIVAHQYENATRLLSFGRDSAWKRTLVSLVPTETGGIILDIATGNADLAALVLERCPRAFVAGCDFSAEMLELGCRRCAGLPVGLSRQDMSALSVRSGSIDTVTGGYALRNAPDVAQAISEVRRVLKPGGTALFLDFSRSAHPAAWFVQYRLLRLWGRLWGRLLHGDPQVYGYLAESLRHYPDRRTLHALFVKHGFQVEKSRTRMGGLIEILVVRRGS